ncbi:hypothetical protein IPC438_14885 [Pseudomonas aeruginosa]|nr:hypothetical protein IPC438_14885 [Pseudomonas aeruginosa]
MLRFPSVPRNPEFSGLSVTVRPFDRNSEIAKTVETTISKSPVGQLTDAFADLFPQCVSTRVSKQISSVVLTHGVITGKADIPFSTRVQQ